MSRNSKTKRRNPGFREVRARAAANVRPPRAARLPEFIGATVDPDDALGKLCVLVVGGGSVGGEVIEHAARLQVGEIWICDPGRFKPESLLTHGITPDVVGKYKARHWGRQAKAISPSTNVYTFVSPVQALSMSAFGKVDLVVMATDNLAAEIEVGRRCLRQRKPLFQASVHGASLVAQSRYWSNRDGSGSCPACAFAAAEWSHVSRETVFRCSGPDGRPVADANVISTMSTSCLCGLVANLTMVNLLRHTLRLGQPLEDSVTEYCGYTHRTTVSPLVRNYQCRAEHVAWNTVRVEGNLSAQSLRRLAQKALGYEGLPPEVAFSVGDDLEFVEKVSCCGWPHTVRRFRAPGASAGSCSRCGATLVPQSFYSHRPVPAAVLGPMVDRPLRRLGAGTARSIVVHGDARTVLCQEEGVQP